MSLFVAALWVALMIVLHMACRGNMSAPTYAIFVFSAITGTLITLWFVMSWLAADI